MATTNQGSNDNPSAIQPQPQEISISDANVKITGIDCIWTNIYADSNFRIMRKWHNECDLDTVLLFITDHVRQGLYSIVAITATKHMVVVTCACEKNWEELPDGWFVMN